MKHVKGHSQRKHCAHEIEKEDEDDKIEYEIPRPKNVDVEPENAVKCKMPMSQIPKK